MRFRRSNASSGAAPRRRDPRAQCRVSGKPGARPGGAERAIPGVELPYSTLTGFCRRFGIGTEPPVPKGRYHFGPGEETQHDTSPHDVVIRGRKQRVQCASAALCFSRMLYAQAYPTFNRFYCKVFLTEAFESFGGATGRVMIDNTHVIIAYGTGADAVPAPEMAAFAERFDTAFVAHEVGDANRSARVEAPFNFIERNFYPGRTFESLADLNGQLRAWCEKKSHRFIKTIQARPIELFQTDRLHLKPLPLHIPEVYALHQRLVDLEGYVHLHANFYSVDPADRPSSRGPRDQGQGQALRRPSPRRRAPAAARGSKSALDPARALPQGTNPTQKPMSAEAGRGGSASCGRATFRGLSRPHQQETRSVSRTSPSIASNLHGLPH